MKSIIENSLSQSHSYVDYRNHIKDLLKEGKSTGKEQSQALTDYSELNETRMNRLEKTILIADENVQKLQVLEKEYIWLVISEGWCGDAAQIVPVINKMAKLSEKIDLKIVFRDEKGSGRAGETRRYFRHAIAPLKTNQRFTRPAKFAR